MTTAHAKAAASLDDVIERMPDGRYRMTCGGVRFELWVTGNSLLVTCLDDAIVVEPNTTQTVVLSQRVVP